MSRLLLVDDEPLVLKALRRVLSLAPIVSNGVSHRPEIDLFTEPEAALAKARHTAYDVVISDYRMPAMDGVELLTQFRSIQPNTVRIILSGHADLNGLIGAINQAGIDRFIAKPWNDSDLVSTVAEALTQRELRMENERLADQARLAQGSLSAEEAERRRLEAIEPGITRVNWGPDGSVLLDESLLDPPSVRTTNDRQLP